MTIQFLGVFESRYDSVKNDHTTRRVKIVQLINAPDEWRIHALPYDSTVLQNFPFFFPSSLSGVIL